MKLIKINTDHYIIVDDSEIKEGDWFFANQGLRKCIRVDDKTSCPYITLNEKGEEIGHFHTWRGTVTHSTQPLEDVGLNTSMGNQLGFDKIEPMYLSEVKELLGEMDVEKMGYNESFRRDVLYNQHSTIGEQNAFIDGTKYGYNQALKDNKEKKYTEEDLKRYHNIMCLHGNVKGEEYIQSLQSKTEWEVELIDNKLKLL